MAASFTQVAFRFRNDNGNETTATWRQNQNVNDSVPVNTNFRIRFEIQNTTTSAGNNKVWQLQYNRNSAGWLAVNASSLVVRSSASPNLADAANLTNQLTLGTGTFQGLTGFDEVDGAAGGNSMDVAASGHAEAEYSVQVRGVDVNAGDTIQLRVTDAGTAITYSVTPTLSVLKAVQGQLPKTLGALTLTAAASVASPPISAELDKTLNGVGIASTMFRFRLADLSKTLGAITANAFCQRNTRGVLQPNYLWSTVGVAGWTAGLWANTAWQSGLWDPGVWEEPRYVQGGLWADGVWAAGVWADIPTLHKLGLSSVVVRPIGAAFGAVLSPVTLATAAASPLTGGVDIDLDVISGLGAYGEGGFGEGPYGGSYAIAQGQLALAAATDATLDAVTLSGEGQATESDTGEVALTLRGLTPTPLWADIWADRVWGDIWMSVLSTGSLPITASVGETLDAFTLQARNEEAELDIIAGDEVEVVIEGGLDCTVFMNIGTTIRVVTQSSKQITMRTEGGQPIQVGI